MKKIHQALIVSAVVIAVPLVFSLLFSPGSCDVTGMWFSSLSCENQAVQSDAGLESVTGSLIGWNSVAKYVLPGLFVSVVLALLIYQFATRNKNDQ
ncbi:hypothetical protein ACFL3V_00305 [Nanoarchaeota archaeon]